MQPGPNCLRKYTRPQTIGDAKSKRRFSNTGDCYFRILGLCLIHINYGCIRISAWPFIEGKANSACSFVGHFMCVISRQEQDRSFCILTRELYSLCITSTACMLSLHMHNALHICIYIIIILHPWECEKRVVYTSAEGTRGIRRVSCIRAGMQY